ncbi:MAG: hypothetical protein M3340_04315, partial [Actinomycetota bacterium]|nr:hypothetical protein [Actinomycetota bacterium]
MVAAVVLAVCVAVSVSSSTSARPGQPSPPVPFDPETSASEADEIRVAQEREKARRATPEAREDRSRSREAYRRLSPRDAAELAVDRFAQLFSPADGRLLQLHDGEKVKRYLGDHAALVDVPGQSSSVLVESMLPLRAEDEGGDLAPVDLDLTERGTGFEPRNPLSEVSFSRSPRSALNMPGLGTVGLRTNAAADGFRVRNEVFYGEAETDTDMWVKPAPGGAALAFQLRSDASPERLPLDLDLPGDVELERDGRSGAVALVKDDEMAGVIGAPSAFDAEGHPVETSWRLDGRNLVLAVPHRDADVRYPLAVDPVVEYWDLRSETPGANYQPVGWDYFESDPVCNETPTQNGQCGSFWHMLYNDTGTADGTAYTNGRGLFIRRNAGGSYADGEYAQYYYTSP